MHVNTGLINKFNYVKRFYKSIHVRSFSLQTPQRFVLVSLLPCSFFKINKIEYKLTLLYNCQRASCDLVNVIVHYILLCRL